MNPVNETQMKEFASEFGLEKSSPSDQFEAYAAYCVMQGNIGENIDPLLVTLAGSEFGIDGVAILVNGQLVINSDEASDAIEGVKNPDIHFHFIQAKTSEGFDYGDASKFFDAILDFFDDAPAKTTNQLQDLIDAKNLLYSHAVKHKNPGISAYYCATGSYKENIAFSKLIGKFRNDISDTNLFDETAISVEMLGAGQLQKLYRSALTAASVTFEFSKSVILPPHPNVEEAYVGYLPASEVLKLISELDENGSIVGVNHRVFYDNVRDFNESSTINKSIASSLDRGEAEHFVFRNNGITVVTRNLSRTGDKFSIEDYQIVNGCQTSNIIFNEKTRVSDVNIPFRLIATRDENFISSIISGTNLQNVVKPDQFWALSAVMKNLEEYCNGRHEVDRLIHFERRENQYRNQKIEKSRVITMQPFLKSVVAALLQLPHKAARNYKLEINDRKDHIFADSQDVRLFHAAAYLHYRLEFLWRNQRIDILAKIYRYYIMYAVGYVALEGQAFLHVKNKNIGKFSDSLCKIADDEARMKKIVDTVTSLLDKELSKQSVDAREKLRDTIRLDSFFNTFRKAIEPEMSRL